MQDIAKLCCDRGQLETANSNNRVRLCAAASIASVCSREVFAMGSEEFKSELISVVLDDLTIVRASMNYIAVIEAISGRRNCDEAIVRGRMVLMALLSRCLYFDWYYPSLIRIIYSAQRFIRGDTRVTRLLLSPVVGRKPKLTVKLLTRPPFKFVRDVVTKFTKVCIRNPQAMNFFLFCRWICIQPITTSTTFDVLFGFISCLYMVIF